MQRTISFISELYQGRIPRESSQDGFEEIERDLVYFGVEPQIYSMLQTKQLQKSVPESFLNKLKDQTDIATFQNMLIKSEQKKLLDAFNQLHIEVIPLKGTYFAEKYFGKLSARGTTDIDLLVRKKDVLRAEGILQFMNYKREIGDPSHFHSEFCKAFDRPEFPYLNAEIHWNIVREDTSQTESDIFWKHAVSLEPYQSVKELSVQHTFYHICLHGINHHMASLKYFLDIMHLIHNYKDVIDYPTLFDQARFDQNYSKVLIALTLVYRTFPHLQQVKPLPFSKKYPLWNWERAKQAVAGKKGLNYGLFRLISTYAVCDTWKHRGAQLGFMFFGLPLLYWRKSRA